MTEIPEHLLKRSRERRSAMGGESGSAAESSPTPATPAAAAPAAPVAAAAPAAPKVAAPKPVPAYLAAAQNRRRVPIWAMPVLAALPLWLFLYVNAMTRQPKKVTGPLAVGATVYGVCSSCHGSAGDGAGAIRKLSEGEVLKTFPNIEDQIRFVYNGNKAYYGKPYGDPNRAGGPHVAGSTGAVSGGMPQQGALAGGALSDAEILAVICEERYTLSGADPNGAKYAKEFAEYCAPDAPKWLEVEEGGFKGAKIETDPATAFTST